MKYAKYFSLMSNIKFHQQYMSIPATAMIFYVKCVKYNLNPTSADVDPEKKFAISLGICTDFEL